MVIYFTGTGNSRYAANMIAAATGDECVNAGEFIKAGERAALSSKSPWVFVCPTYAWRIPYVFEEFIRSSSFAGSEEAYFVMTCGGEIGNAGVKIEQLCKEKRFEYKGVWQTVMPENYIAMFNAPDKSEAENIIKSAQPGIKEAASFIAERKAFPRKKVTLMNRLCTSAINPMFYAFAVKANQFRVSDSCTGCGGCERGCVLNNIKIVDKKPQWGKNCTHCMACICACPQRAVEYGSHSVGKPRYQCPEYVDESKDA